MKVFYICFAILASLLVIGLVYYAFDYPRNEATFHMQDIDYYLVLSREDIGILEVSKHNPGDIIYALCQEINHIRHWSIIWPQIYKKAKSLGYDTIHDTPWNEFTIEEKAAIAMYGGSGSKLSKEEIKEFEGKYATK